MKAQLYISTWMTKPINSFYASFNSQVAPNATENHNQFRNSDNTVGDILRVS